MIQSLQLRVGIFLAVAVLSIGGFWLFAGQTPQPLEYHNFADARPMVGVPNALNVLSNAPFILVGVLGFVFLFSERSHRPGIFLTTEERWPYWMYFLGLVLTGIGSSYYHAEPNNATLVWDRAALALTFMALFTGILAERLHPACARWLLVPLIALGVGSVFYWDWTEQHGVGDLRVYLAVQFFPLVVLPILLVFYPARYTRSGDLLASLLCYVIAKVLEWQDARIYTGSGFVSGHTLKHLVAGLSAGFILLMLMYRQPREQAAERPVLAPAAAE
jgi:hypothetical protein